MFTGISEYPVTPVGEPMTLGSPTGSPVANIPGPSPYLPGYLMGDTSSQGGTPGSRMWGVPGSLSPSKNRPTSVGSLPNNMSPQKSLMSPTVQTSSISSVPRGYMRQASTDKHSGGPPVQGLFDNFSSPTLQSSSFCTVPGSTPLRSAPNILSPNSSFGSLQSPSKTNAPEVMLPPSPAQLDPFYSQRDLLKSDDVLDVTWVTVFGFPPAAASYILQQFYHYGNIIEHKMSPNGNWMHIRYQTKLQAKIALSKNGKVYSNNVMVGVAPCIDKNVMNASRTSVSAEVSQSNDSFYNRSLSQNPTAFSPARLAFQYARNDTSVIQAHSIPRKSTGLVSKAMEYLFGW